MNSQLAPFLGRQVLASACALIAVAAASGASAAHAAATSALMLPASSMGIVAPTDRLSSSQGQGDGEESGDSSARSESDGALDWLRRGHLYGYLGESTWKFYYDGFLHNQSATSFAGTLNYLSPHFDHFQFGLGVFTQQNLGLSPHGASRYTDLGDNTGSVGRAFLRFDYDGLSIKAGRFGITTPFASTEPPPFLILPLSYQGIAAKYKIPIGGANLTIYGYRIYKWLPFGHSRFTYSDAGKPTEPIAAAPAVFSSGFASAGFRLDRRGYELEGWWYNFRKRGNLAYVHGHVPLVDCGPLVRLDVGSVKPFLDVRLLREWNTGDQVPFYRNVDARLYNADVGVLVAHNKITLNWYLNPRRDGARQNGAWFSPYQYGSFNFFPFTVTAPNFSANTVQQPGNGYGVQDIFVYGKWFIMSGYVNVRYYPTTQPLVTVGQNRWTAYSMITYHVTRQLGVTVLGSYLTNKSPATGNFSNLRLYVIYKFGREPADRGEF